MQHCYIKEKKLIDKATAGIMLVGILSDTLNLRSPTTTETDKFVAVVLAKVAGVDDLNWLAQQLFRAKSNMITKMTPP